MFIITLDTRQVVGIIAAIALCGFWVWLYFRHIAPLLRRKYGERLGIRVMERPTNSVFTGASVSWSGKGASVGFEKHLSLLLMEIASFLFVFLLPIAVILFIAITLLDQLSPSKP